MTNGRVYKTIRTLSNRFAVWERRLWWAVLVVFVATSLLSLIGRIFPEISQAVTQTSGLASGIFAGVGFFQWITGALVFVLPIARTTFTRNPAETLAIDFLKRAYPALVEDVTALVHRREVRFDAEFLQIAQSLSALDSISHMNATCFQDSAHYGGAVDEKTSRNRSIYAKNSSCFGAIHNEQGKVIGFSIIVPLNREAARTYKRGRLSDLDISSIHVAAPNEDCRCILLFAIGLNAEFDIRKKAPSQSRHIRQVIRCHVLHAYKVAELYDTDKIEFIAQVEKPSIKKFLCRFGMTRLQDKGYDGDPLFVTNWSALKLALPLKTSTGSLNSR